MIINQTITHDRIDGGIDSNHCGKYDVISWCFKWLYDGTYEIKKNMEIYFNAIAKLNDFVFGHDFATINDSK